MTYPATLVGDGSSDALLKPLLEWLLAQHLPTGAAVPIAVPEWGRLPIAVPTLPARLLAAHTFFPADVYFVHRDTEKDGTWQGRCHEIAAAAAQVFAGQVPHLVRVVPVRMTETWLLHNEAAIRAAAENPNGRQPLALPHPARLEALPEAKTHLLHLLRQASELTGRRLRRFEAHERHRLYRLADLQQETGFAVLRQLPSFRALEQEIIGLVAALATPTNP